MAVQLPNSDLKRPLGRQEIHDPIKKRHSLKSFLAIFRIPKSSGDKEARYLGKHVLPGRTAASYSTPSLQQETVSSIGITESDFVFSTLSLPSQVRTQVLAPFTFHSLSSSSSSASSLDLGSNSSTNATTPSTSSPSILIKASAPIADIYTHLPYDSTVSSYTVKKFSRVIAEPYHKQPSPLSTVMDAQPPYKLPAHQTLPSYERRNSFQPKRRNPLSRILLRRTQSNPDLAQLSDSAPAVPPIPATAPSRPSTASRSLSPSGSPARSRTFRKRPLEAVQPTAYSKEDKIEHRSILFADPAGLGYYLYPTTDRDSIIRKNIAGRRLARPLSPSMTDDQQRNSWPSIDSSSTDSSHQNALGTRAWRDCRGRSFRSDISVLAQVIPEETGDGVEINGNTDKRYPTGQDGLYWRQRYLPEAAPLTLGPLSRRIMLPSIDSRLDSQWAVHVPLYNFTAKHASEIRGYRWSNNRTR